MKSGLGLLALSMTVAAQAGPFDLIHGIDRDILVGDPVAYGHASPTVMNSDFVISFAETSAEPIGAGALHSFYLPLRPPRATAILVPIGFERTIPALDLHDLDANLGTVGGGSMDVLPTPGALALLGAGGLGLAGRRGGS